MSPKVDAPRLTDEENDTVSDLVHTDQVIPLLKLMQYFAHQRETDLVTFTYKPGQEPELIHRKSKATGAREFFNSFKRHLEKIKGRKLL